LKVTDILRFMMRLVTDKQRRIAFISSVNDDYYWDDYVRNWEESEFAGMEFLGDEWRGPEVFLSLLKKYSNPTMTSLEIGCGAGRITAKAANHFKLVHAGDVSREMLRKCEESVEAPNVRYYKLDGFTLKEFGDESLDFVFSHDVFVHFSSLQVYPYLAEIKRVLRPGGTAIISFFGFSLYFAYFRKVSLDFWSRRMFPTGMREHFITEEMVGIMAKDLDIEIVETNREAFLVVVFRKRPNQQNTHVT
jgi:SAM-dependent methyltransferase